MKWKYPLLFLGLISVLALAAAAGIGCSGGTGGVAGGCAAGCQTTWLGDGLCDNACNNVACNYDGGDCLLHDDSRLSFTNGGLTLTAATAESGGKKTTTITDSNGNTLLTSELTIYGVKLTFPGVADPTIITFPEPLDELSTNYTASLLAVYVAGQIELSESGVMPDSPGCDWFYDESCTLGCCAHHDKCYYDNDCSALSWAAFIGSNECKACNYVASHCIVSGCSGVNSPTFTGPEVGTCYDRKCDQFYSCSTLVGGQAGKMNCACTPPPCATPIPTPTPSDYCAPGCYGFLIGDEHCDSACNVEACNFDKGDCDRCEPSCPSSIIGDKKCDQHCYNAACNWDNGDCAIPYNECAPGCPASWIKDGECDSTCNNVACYYDRGDCSATPTPSRTTAPTATQSGSCATDCPSSYIGDGRCDLACYNAACNYDGGNGGSLYDGGDCSSYPHCAYGCLNVAVGDGWCDSACNNAACNYDGGDCSSEPTPTQGSGGSATPSPTQSGCYCESGDTECFNAPCN